MAKMFTQVTPVFLVTARIKNGQIRPMDGTLCAQFYKWLRALPRECRNIYRLASVVALRI